jgi:hypothetical protein
MERTAVVLRRRGRQGGREEERTVKHRPFLRASCRHATKERSTCRACRDSQEAANRALLPKHLPAAIPPPPILEEHLRALARLKLDQDAPLGPPRRTP